MESKMKVSKVRKTTFLLSQKESNAAQVRKYLCLFDKNQNKNAKTESPKKKCLGKCRIEIHFIEDDIQYITQFTS